MIDQFLQDFAQLGVGYLIAVLEGFVIVWLFRRMDGKDKIIENRDTIIQTLQEKRVEDFRDNSEKIINLGNALLSTMQNLKEVTLTQTNAIIKILESKKA